MWNKNTIFFYYNVLTACCPALTTVITMPHHHSMWACYMETVAMGNSSGVVSEGKKRIKIIWSEQLGFFLQILLLVTFIPEEKDVIFLLSTFVLQVNHQLAQPLLSFLHHLIFLKSIHFMVVEKMKSCFCNKQQHKLANSAQHNGILMYSSCWHSVFQW